MKEPMFPMSIEEVVELMETSRSEREWDANCDRVKTMFDGYPHFWYESIILGGVLQRCQQNWTSNVVD